MSAGDPHPAEAGTDDLALTLHWQPAGDAALRGELVARNVGDRPVRVTGKPGLVLVDERGRDLADSHVVTLEFRLPGYAVVPPGGSARATVSLTAWDGTPLGDTVGVVWSQRRVDVRTTGPQQPAVASRHLATSSSWFVTD